MEELKAICTLITVVAGAAAVLLTPIKKAYEKHNAEVEGLRCLLRGEMLRIYYRHRDDKSIRQYEAENFEHNYKAYVALGGNSFIENVHEEVSSWEIVS